jgi:hypothetical protein
MQWPVFCEKVKALFCLTPSTDEAVFLIQNTIINLCASDPNVACPACIGSAGTLSLPGTFYFYNFRTAIPPSRTRIGYYLLSYMYFYLPYITDIVYVH